MVLWCRISLGANRHHFETRPRSRVQNSKVGLVAFPAAACFLQGRDHAERQEDLLSYSNLLADKNEKIMFL